MKVEKPKEPVQQPVPMEMDQEPVKKEKKDKKLKKQNKEVPKETTLKDVTDIIASVAKSTGESNPNGGNVPLYLTCYIYH